MTLATTLDVEAILQVDIQPDDDPKVETLLGMADELITDRLGRDPIGGVEVVEVFRSPGYRTRQLMLTRWPVTSIGSVDLDGSTVVDPDDYRADLDAGILTRTPATLWTFDAPVTVTYTPATVPGLRTVAASMVARALRAGQAYAATLDAGLAGFKSLTVGRWNASADTPSTGLAAAGEALYLTDYEAGIVDGWRDRRP